MAKEVDVKNITGTARTVKDLFGNKYGLEYYQREYAWTEANVSELVNDLTTRFLDEFDESHERKRVASYKPYFLGPIVTSLTEGIRYLVDGQQRLTTLLLLLIHLHHLSEEQGTDANLKHLIFSEQYGERTFNIDVDEREQVMHSIFDGTSFELSKKKQSVSVRNIWEQYNNIDEMFPRELQKDNLPYFIDWLLGRVFLVEIGTTDQNMALEIFETMNDRGLRLSNTDMLKSLLLSRIEDRKLIEESNVLWRDRVLELSDFDRNAESDFIKNWLRGKFAETIREGKKASAPGDFDIIGSAFHKWVRDNDKRMNLHLPKDYATFVDRDFERMSARYIQLLKAGRYMTPDLEHVFYNAYNRFTLQYLPVLAAVNAEDSDEIFVSKTSIITKFLDMYIARRMVNYRNIGQSSVKNTMFSLAKEVPNIELEDLRIVLSKRVGNIVADSSESFDNVKFLRLGSRNGRYIRYLLARITAWIDVECGIDNSFSKYVKRDIKNPHEVEHIWANKYERHKDDFISLIDFEQHRNLIGALLLLPKDFNASYGDKPYSEKIIHYQRHNLLAQSLHPSTYSNNPSFLRFKERTGLPFDPYPVSFTKDDIEERQDLYRQICEKIWDPATLGLA